MGFREQIVNLLTEVTELPIEEVTLLLAIPPDQKMGDYSFPCFKIGGKKKADEIKEKIGETKFLSEIKVVGPYVNFYLNKSVYCNYSFDLFKYINIITMIADTQYLL